MNKLFIIIFIFIAPKLSYGGLSCNAATSVDIAITEKLTPHLNNVSAKTSKKIIKKLFKKIDKNKQVSENDVYNLSRVYYKALRKGPLKEIIQRFSKDKMMNDHKLTAEFHNELTTLLMNSGQFKEVNGRWGQLTSNFKSKFQYISSWATYAALHGSIIYMDYLLSGTVNFIPLYLPTLFKDNFKENNKAKIATKYYTSVLNTTFATLLSVKLAVLAFDPMNRTEFIEVIQNQFFNKNQSEVQAEIYTEMFDLTEIKAENDLLLKEAEEYLRMIRESDSQAQN